jgi:hypothetical protein
VNPQPPPGTPPGWQPSGPGGGPNGPDDPGGDPDPPSSSSSKSTYSSSSSQEIAAKPNERGSNAVYTVNDCFSSGLDNMEPGKCYGLNPDRGTQHGWINNNAQDKWWWEERACDCSSLVEPVTPGGCKNNVRGANAVYTADNCFSGGLDNMEPGKCYSLNPSRGTQYGWINNDARDRWWWVEVSCGGEEEPELCPSEFLGKKSFAKENYNSKEAVSYDSYEVWGKNTKFYDALGRKTQARPETRRYLFSPKIDKKAAYKDHFDSWNESNNYISADLYTTHCYKNSRDERWICKNGLQLSVLMKDGNTCGIKGEDYAYAKADGTLIGGYTCTEIKVEPFPKNYNWTPCPNDRSKIQVNYKLEFITTLISNEPFSVVEGDKFKDSDYIATKEDEIAVRYHELGHVKYNSCLNFPVITKRICGCYREEEINKIIEQEINEIKDKHGKLLNDMSDLFHKKYGAAGYATSYECPN